MFSFSRRKSQMEVQRLLRRVMDVSSPDVPNEQEEMRGESRSNRSIPVLLTPHVDSQLLLRETETALTKNLCSQGLALIVTKPFQAERVVVGFWHEERPEYLLGEVRQNVFLGCGFWQLAVELLERLIPADHPELAVLTSVIARLQPEEAGRR